jgi:hypothetical protein
MLLTLIGGMLAFGLVPFLARNFVNKLPTRCAIDRILLLEPVRAIGFALFPSLGLQMIPWFWWIVAASVALVLSLFHWLPIRSRFLKAAE